MGLPGLPTTQTIGTQVAGRVVNNQGQNDGMWATGFNVPNVSSYLSYKFPRFYLTSLLDRMAGRSIGIPGTQHIWGEKDRTRPIVTIASLLTAVGSPTINVTVSAASLPAMVVGRSLYGSSSVDATPTERLQLYAYVTAVSGTTITLAKRDGTNWTAAEIGTASYQSLFGIGPVYVGEASSAPGGFWTPPTAMGNYLSNIRASRTFSGDMLTQKSYLGPDHTDINQYLMEFLLEFQIDRELRLKFGRQSSGTVLLNEGIFDSVFLRGSNSNFGGPYTEAAMQNHMATMMAIASKREWLVLCGTKFNIGFFNANKDYALRPGELASSIGGDSNVKNVVAGYICQTYNLQNATVHVIEDPMFDDPNILTMTGNTSMGSYRNFKEAAIWLNLGPGLADSQPLIRMMHNEGNGRSRKFVYDEIHGQTGTPLGGGASSEDLDFFRANRIATDTDGVTCLLMSQEGVETRNAHWSGWQFKTA